MKKKILYIGIFNGIIVLFLLYFSSFTNTTVNNLYLSIYQEDNNGWEITELVDDKEVPLTATKAINSTNTVFLRRIVTEDMLKYSRFDIDSGRAVSIFIDNELVFSNHKANITSPQELPLMKAPQDQPFTLTHSIYSSWVGKTLTLVTRLYENTPYASITFDLISEEAQLFQHEAWVNQQALPGAMFGLLFILLFGLFLFQFYTTKKGIPILFLAFASLLQAINYMSVLNENPLPSIDNGLAMAFFILFPLLYLGTKLTKSKKVYFIGIITSWILYIVLYISTFHLNIPMLPYWFDHLDIICFIPLMIMLYSCLIEYRNNIIIKKFINLMLLFYFGYFLLFFITSLLNTTIHQYMIIIFKEAANLYFSPLISWIFNTILFTLFIITIWEVLQDRIHVTEQIEQIKNEQTILHIQMEGSTKQIETLRNAQQQTVIYRHDMRHHLSLISRYAMEGNLKKIRDYLEIAESDISCATPVRYCENETVNSILFYFNEKAKQENISLTTTIHLPEHISINDTELCSLISNGLENAMKAVSHIQKNRTIHITAHIENNNLLISIDNPFIEIIEWKDGLPISSNKKEGHGFGIKSIVAIVEKYNGVYSFTAKDNIFTLRVMLTLHNLK